jgi:hypothetical protein
MSLDMKNTARTIKNEMICRNWKCRILIVAFAILAVYFIMVIICGNFALKNCF